MSPLNRPRNLEPCYFTGCKDSTIDMSAYFRPHGSAILACRWGTRFILSPCSFPYRPVPNRFVRYFAQTGHSHFAATRGGDFL